MNPFSVNDTVKVVEQDNIFLNKTGVVKDIDDSYVHIKLEKGLLVIIHFKKLEKVENEPKSKPRRTKSRKS